MMKIEIDADNYNAKKVKHSHKNSSHLLYLPSCDDDDDEDDIER